MESAAHLKETLEGINISREKAEKFPCEGRLSLGDDPGGYRANRCSSGMDGGAAHFLPPDEGDDGASLIRLPPRDPYLARGETLVPRSSFHRALRSRGWNRLSNRRAWSPFWPRLLSPAGKRRADEKIAAPVEDPEGCAPSQRAVRRRRKSSGPAVQPAN